MGNIVGSVHSIQIGKSSGFTRPRTTSAINKKTVEGPVYVDDYGICGDEQADLKHHGGLDKAVHIYPFEYYKEWRQDIGNLTLFNNPGAFGENISTLGITEQELYIGDQLRIGSVLFEISQGRQPCWKLNDRFQMPDMAARVQETLRTGYYCRVLEAGFINSGDKIILLPNPDAVYSIKQVMRIIFERELDKDVLEKLLELPLVESWRKLVERRLNLAQADDVTSRLIGPDKHD